MSSWALGGRGWGPPGGLGCGTLPLVPAVPLSCSVSDSEGKLVVREVATRPLTQDLLSHEVRGCGDPQAQLPSRCTCPLSPRWEQCQGLEPFSCQRLPHARAPSLCLSLPPVGLLHPGPGGPEDLRVEGEECQCPGEDRSHEPGTGGRGGQGGEGRETDAAGRGKWGQTGCSARQRPWKALGLTQLGVLRVSSIAVLGGSLHARGPGSRQPGGLLRM